MTNFNYEKAYCVLAVPAFNALNDRQKKAHSDLLPLVKELNQGKDLNIPLSADMGNILNLTCKEIAELSNASYFVGHWQPSLLPVLYENKSGESWKIANVCDQILRKRLMVPYNIQIHEGKLRVTFSSRDCWMWEEFGLATEKNIEIFKTCGLNFGANTLNDSAKQLKDICGDLWPEVENIPNNEMYDKLLELKKEKALIDVKKRHEQKLKELKNKVDEAKIELTAFTWLIEHDVDENLIDNCIYYFQTGRFCFGWRDKLTQEQREKLTTALVGFPFKYDCK